MTKGMKGMFLFLLLGVLGLLQLSAIPVLADDPDPDPGIYLWVSQINHPRHPMISWSKKKTMDFIDPIFFSSGPIRVRRSLAVLHTVLFFFSSFFLPAGGRC